MIYLFAILLIIVLCMVFAVPFALLWNYAVVKAIDVANPIDYPVAFCLLLFMILFVAGSKTSSE